MISRRNLLGAKGKHMILVDHNERTQAVPRAWKTRIFWKIIDHHRLGTVQTMSPVFFRNQPLGCTATIIYQMYQENNVEIDKNTAGLSMQRHHFRYAAVPFPTCTPVDKAAALASGRDRGDACRGVCKEDVCSWQQSEGKDRMRRSFIRISSGSLLGR